VREKDEAEKIMALVVAGVSDERISKLLDVPRPRVQKIRLQNRILRKLPEKPRGPSQPPEPPPPRGKVNPITDSAHWLGARLKEVPGKGFFLDGVPTSTGGVVKAANEMKARMGVSQSGPEHWRVPVIRQED
jgi:hypothetical protein